MIALTPQEEADALARTQALADALAAANSPAQIEAECVAALTNGGASRIDLQRLVLACQVSSLARDLGKAPGQLTAQELAAERARVAAIYKAL